MFSYNYMNSDDTVLLEIDGETLKFNRYDVEKRKIESDEWTSEIKVVFDKSKGSRVSDYLSNNLGWIIVTEKLKNIIESMGNEGVQFLPIRAVSQDGMDIIDAYVVNIYNYVDAALDLERSIYTMLEVDEQRKLMIVVKPVLNSNAIKGIDIFKIPESFPMTFISERLKNAIELSGATQCKYYEVKVV